MKLKSQPIEGMCGTKAKMKSSEVFPGLISASGFQEGLEQWPEHRQKGLKFLFEYELRQANQI